MTPYLLADKIDKALMELGIFNAVISLRKWPNDDAYIQMAVHGYTKDGKLHQTEGKCIEGCGATLCAEMIDSFIRAHKKEPI